MMRHCDGTDRNLNGPDGEPCGCGLHFDDVELTVIFPHLPIGPKPTPEQVDLILAELSDAPGMGPATLTRLDGPVTNVIRHDRIVRSLCVEEATVTRIGIMIVHVCVRFADHAPDHKHMCKCLFTWESPA